jgi:4a-hydroxytetrahydrobiopterin dehydratase
VGDSGSCRLHATTAAVAARRRLAGQPPDGIVSTMAELLKPDQVRSGLQERPRWSGDLAGIARTVTFASFPTAITAVDRVAVVAEALDHHPDMDIRWRSVTFRCATHSAGGVTAQDLELADRIDQVVAELGGDAPDGNGAA